MNATTKAKTLTLPQLQLLALIRDPRGEVDTSEHTPILRRWGGAEVDYYERPRLYSGSLSALRDRGLVSPRGARQMNVTATEAGFAVELPAEALAFVRGTAKGIAIARALKQSGSNAAVYDIQWTRRTHTAEGERQLRDWPATDFREGSPARAWADERDRLDAKWERVVQERWAITERIAREHAEAT